MSRGRRQTQSVGPFLANPIVSFSSPRHRQDLIRGWLACLRRGLSRRFSTDRLAGPNARPGTIANLRNLRPFVDRHWHKGLLGAFLILLTSLFAVPQPLIARYIVDDVILGRQLGLLAGAILLLVGISAAEKLTQAFGRFTFARLEQEVTLDIHQDLLTRVLRFPKAFFDDKQTGYLMSRLSADVEGLRWFFSDSILYGISNLLRFVGGAGLLLYLEWRLALIVFTILPGLVFCIRYFSGKLHVLSHQEMEQQANVSSRLQESLSAVPLIKAFASERYTVGRLMSGLKGAFEISLEQSTLGSMAKLAIDSLPGLARAIVLAVGAYWVVRDQWSLGSLLAFQVYLGYLFGPAQFLATANLELQNAWAALERVSALFDIRPEENMGTGTRVQRLRGEIEFRNVSFSYAGREPILQNVSFRVAPGEHVAVVGPSGVGKTTLVSLILRFYQPTAGEIFFDGEPASRYEVGSLRGGIGYVSQQTLLLSGTILENLLYGNPGAGQEQVGRAARVAGIHDFIRSLPEGYGAEIGENGANLSEGQKQRLAIARALVKDPDILVLDEPTSALDSLAERSIFHALPSLVRNKTLVVVAHRPSTIAEAGRILLLNERELVATGTHASLLETCEYYRAVVSGQERPAHSPPFPPDA